MTRGRLAAGIAITVLLAIALTVILLQGRDRPTVQVTPTTVSVTSTTTPPTTEAEPPRATGENWLAIMREILAYRHYLYEHPQPNLLDQIYDKRCPCYAQEQKALADLQRRGRRYDDEGVNVVKTKLLGRARGNPSIVAVEVTGSSSPQVLVDRSGKILERKPGSGSMKTAYQLLRGKDDRWRVTLIGISQPGG